MWINAPQISSLIASLPMKRLPVITAALLPVPAWAADAPVEAYPWMHRMMWGGGWYGMIIGPVLVIVVIAVAIAVAVLTARSLGGPYGAAPPHYPHPGRTPLDILKERFARGEIDKDEFQDRRRVLGE